MLDEKKIARAFGIYKGANRLKQGRVTVFPVTEALAAIESGEIGFD